MREREEAGWGHGGPDESWRGRGEDFSWRSHRGHGHGRPGRPEFPPGPPGAGFGAWFGDPRSLRAAAWRRRGPRARRGDVRAAALALLAAGPMNGYQIIQEIGERSDGVWRPSPGSVYPALQQLEDEGLIRAEPAENGRRAFQLTDEGRAYVAAHPDELRDPWDAVTGSVGDTAIEMRRLIGQVAMAAFQVVSAGTDSQAAQARQVLTDARKALYRLLAADDE